jgi:hypothetical protein
MPQHPRGIAPDLLISQVKNTMPYLFEKGAPAALLAFPAAQIVLETEKKDLGELSHFEYFSLCLSAHYLSCATPVPTDVDNQIRQKLWPQNLEGDVAVEMADRVLQSRHWDFTAVSTRWVTGAEGGDWQKQVLSGHLGEWFTVASGAYCALKRSKSGEALKKRQELFEAIADEVRRHSEIFGSLWKAGDGLSCLKASASIAHNFGDLDRVMDMWELDVADPLRLEFYKLGVKPFDSKGKLRYLGRLWVAGELYKSIIDQSAMALENHRHFALRKPKSLRRDPSFLIPTGPFFDDWGSAVAKGLSGEELAEVTDALVQGWIRLPKTQGYGRGLRAILAAHPELSGSVSVFAKDYARKAVLEAPRERFEKLWSEEALRWMDEIPSRAS